ncbi:T-cell surface glycoprotein CD3 delta chain [Austrofundulus limnaeus]|uniref:T-cell surface glycoprotein CD3 delta chain n=1 Tax=Austrofundulus limnaeus TaxID=52670 RepID=A0A2I4BMH4_AUSLI|nr:PREDICTED: T-cell surface glycoprotein CD3 delta chain-like [Austrofundulus limnaeus]
MKCHLLILWTLAVYVSCQLSSDMSIDVIELGDGIKLICKSTDGSNKKMYVTGKGITVEQDNLTLPYEDSNSGEYGCNDKPGIYVKFRSCDNCVELDTTSVVGMAVGNLVASVVVGVAVYLIASKSPSAQPAPTKTRSDRPNRIPNEASGSGSGSGPYQPLIFRHPKEIYDTPGK